MEKKQIKYYLMDIRERREMPNIFIMEFEGIKQVRTYLEINWNLKKYKIRVFELKRCIIDNITKKKKENGKTN